jgi:serine/threonine-protein kinase HipA
MTTTKPITHLEVTTPQGFGGVLSHEDSEYLFSYASDADPSAEISLLMPYRAQQYSDRGLFPIFEVGLPEGYVLEELRNRFAKTARLDPMLLLALTGQTAAIGRLRVDTPAIDRDDYAGSVTLSSILAWSGSEDLFAELSRRYLLRTGLSGVQPKVLVPEKSEGAPFEKGALATSDLIVKSAGERFPGLAVNEFICMSIAKEAGIPVPEFYLSENRKLFVMRRFDRIEDGSALGLEDMTSLMAKGSDLKYDGSYERIARAIKVFCAPEHVATSLAQLFDQVTLSCIVGNGDAHLKNFALLYSHPQANDARMSPAYDIVNTTRYIPEDGLALTLQGSKSLFRAGADLISFGEYCGVNAPHERINQLLEATEAVLWEHSALFEDEPELEAAIRSSYEPIAERYDRRRAPSS